MSSSKRKRRERRHRAESKQIKELVRFYEKRGQSAAMTLSLYTVHKMGAFTDDKIRRVLGAVPRS